MADAFIHRAAYALSAGQQLPSDVDAAKLRKVGDALDKLYAPGAAARDQLLADLASGEEHRVHQYARIIADRVKTSVTAKDLIAAAPYLQLLDLLHQSPRERTDSLRTAFDTLDVNRIAGALKELGIESNPAWAVRLYRNLPEGSVDGVSLRAGAVGQVRERLSQLDTMLAQIDRSEGADQKTALRESAAELFASIVNLYALVDLDARYQSKIDLAQYFDALGVRGVPGFLPSRGGIELEVLGQQVATHFHDPSRRPGQRSVWDRNP